MFTENVTIWSSGGKLLVEKIIFERILSFNLVPEMTDRQIRSVVGDHFTA